MNASTRARIIDVLKAEEGLCCGKLTHGRYRCVMGAILRDLGFSLKQLRVIKPSLRPYTSKETTFARARLFEAGLTNMEVRVLIKVNDLWLGGHAFTEFERLNAVLFVLECWDELLLYEDAGSAQSYS